jgi:hypothetical protein
MTALVNAGPIEVANAIGLALRLNVYNVVVLPQPYTSLKPTKSLGVNDIYIFAGAAVLRMPIVTSDAKAIRAMAAQGVRQPTILVSPSPLRGQ